MKGKIFIYLVLLLSAVSVDAQLITVRSSLQRDTIMIGDQLEFTITAISDPSVKVTMPEISDTLSGKVEVLLPLSSDSLMEGGKRIITESYLVTSFEAGVHLIPVQKIAYSTAQFSDTASTMPLLIRVQAPVVDTSQAIKPIKPPINTPITLAEVVPWVLISYGGLLVITLIMALIWIYLQKGKDPEVFAALREDPPHVIAFRELDKLKEEKLWEKGEVKAFYTRLTEIIRNYMERQYGIPAMESTTEEILETFGKINAEDEVLDEMLQELLQLADLVKFAKEDPLPVDNQTNLNNGYLFVQKTYPMFYRETMNVVEEEQDE